MSFSVRSYWLVTTALASAPYLFSGSMAHAACAPDPAGYGATVVCSGTDVDGFNSSANELDITIEEGAIVDSPDDRAINLYGGGDSLTNNGTVDGDVMLSGLYRSIGGTLKGNLSFGFGHDTFLASLDFEGAPLGVSGIIDPGWGQDAAGYTTTGIKSVSYGLFQGFEVFAAEADGEGARLTITSDQTESGAIRLFGTGTIINEVDFIHPDDIGLPGIPSEEVVIDIWGPYTHVENHASIISGTGIYGKFGAGSILNTGTISSINAAIYSERASGVAVRNSGVIETTGNWGVSIWLSEFRNGYQQLAPENNADTIIENTGTITSEFGRAIYVGQMTASAQVSLFNSGTIAAHSLAIEAVNIFAWGNVRVENSGVISTTGADSTVLSIDSDDSVIINTGTLQSQEAGANVIFTEFADSTIIQNSGTISLLGGGSRTRMLCYGFICNPQQRIPVDYLTEAAAAITIQAREGTVTNEAGGVIEAVGEGATAILVDVSLASQTTIVNAGIIRGPEDSVITTDEGDVHLAGAIQGSDAVEIIDNSGSIIGNIDLAGGDDRFILRNLGTVEGDTQGGDDFDTLVIDTDSDTSVDLSRFLSFEAFEKRGNGTTELNGDAAFDSVEILGGRLTFGQGSDIAIPAIEIAGDSTLTVNGSLSTDVTVGADATLGGSGTINGNVTNNGTLSPGNSPGILTVNGDYAQGAAGTLTIEIVQSASPLTPVTGVDYDRLAVNGALSLDGSLLFDIAPALYADGASYDIATAADGITGDFATISGLPTQGFISFSGAIVSDPAVSVTANNVYRWTVSRRAYASAAMTPNEMATATAFTAALESGFAAPASDTANVLATLDGMSDVDARSLFAATNGEFYGSFLTAGQDISDLFLRTLQLRARSGLAGGWLQGYSAWGNGNGDGNAAGADIGLAGTGAGLDVAIGDHALAGVAFGYGSVNVDAVRGIAKGGGNAWQAALYGRLRWNGMTFSGVFGYGEIDFDGTRFIVVSPLSRIATADAKTKAVYFAVEASRRLHASGVQIEPFLGVSNSRVTLDGFSESDAGALSLNLEKITAAATRAYVGAEVGLNGASSLLPWLRATYSRQVSDNNRHIAQSFFESGAAFTTDGRAPSDDVVAVAAGITWEASERLVLTVGYDGLFREDLDYHGATARLQFAF